MVFSDEEPTRSRMLPRAVPSAPPTDGDLAELVGQLLTATARLQSDVNELKPILSEVRQLRKEIDDDRHALVHGASSSAARHSSNRMAALMGALFTLYEVSAPYLHDLWRMVHK